MKYCSYITLLALCLSAACNTGKDGQQATKVPAKLVDMYDYLQVKDYINGHTSAGEAAKKSFAGAVDAYRNKKELNTAAAGFKTSINQLPTAQAYFELGNVLMDQKDYGNAYLAFNMAERLNYKPTAKLFYNTACALARLDKRDEAFNYLEYAIEAGYNNSGQIMKDEDLASLHSKEYGEYEFTDRYRQAISGAGDPVITLWHDYKRNFITANFPLVLNNDTRPCKEEAISFGYEKFVSDMRTERFSREVGKEFYYIAAVADKQQYAAVVYGVKDLIMGDSAPMNYVLISYDRKGTLIDKKWVGGHKLLTEPYKVCTIQANLGFEVKEYDVQYEKSTDENGFENNKIVSSTLKNTLYYKIADNGHFVEQQQSLTMR